MNEIVHASDPQQWNYVPTELNPADHGTRGLKPSDIPSKWTKGPDFLLQPVTQWSSRPSPQCFDSIYTPASVLVQKTNHLMFQDFSLGPVSSKQQQLSTPLSVVTVIRRHCDI